MGTFQIAGLLGNWGSVAIFCGAKPWPQGVECLVCHGSAKPTSAFRLGYSQAWQWGLNPHVNLCNRRFRSFWARKQHSMYEPYISISGFLANQRAIIFFGIRCQLDSTHRFVHGLNRTHHGCLVLLLQQIGSQATLQHLQRIFNWCIACLGRTLHLEQFCWWYMVWTKAMYLSDT